MFPFRRSWPILTGLGAALIYMFNHYRIAGIEHLHLEARPGAPTIDLDDQFSSSGGQSAFAPDLWSQQYDASQYGIQSSEYAGVNGSWDQSLNVGERFTLLEQRLQQSQNAPQFPDAGAQPKATVTFPVSKPIDAPPGFFPSIPNLPLPNIGLPNVGDSLSNRPNSASAIQTADSAPIPDLLTSVETKKRQQALGVPGRHRGRIRIASFNVAPFGPAKLAKPQVMTTMISILRQYDVVALQGVQSSRDDILPRLVESLNQSGRNYDYMIGPRVGRSEPYNQFAILFDKSRLETDRYQLYTVDDPENLMGYEPLVAWFRCKGVPEAEAFTFSIVNVLIDPNFAEAERTLLPALIEIIEKDGRKEDDWIVAGDFAGGTDQLRHLDPSAVRFAIRDIPTDISGTRMLDTILFPALATDEYTGRSGAFDFLRKHNYSLEQAMEISSHMPVWAEFSIQEGSEPGRLAPPDANDVY